MKVAPDSREEATVMKILLLGESNVGKTSLVTRYSQDRFDAQSNLLTVGIDIRKVSKQVEGRHVLLELWDTAGQEKYKTIPAQYFRGVQGILFVYDITDAESFLHLRDWLDKAAQNSDRSQIGMSLVGNKIDMENIRQVKFEDALSFAKQQGMQLTEASAKESLNVEEVFLQAIRSVLRKGIVCPTKPVKLGPTVLGNISRDSSSCCG